MPGRDPGLGEPFEVQIEELGEDVVLKLSGAFGSECEDQFRAELKDAETRRAHRLILDLRGLTFIDSAGLRMLLETRDRCRSAGLDFAITGGHGQVRRTLELSGLDRELPMLPDPSPTPGPGP